MSTWLPKDTMDALRKPGFFEPDRCESRSLLLNRMPRSADNTNETAAARRTSLERGIRAKASPLFQKSLSWLVNIRPHARLCTFKLFTDGRLVLGLANGINENAGIDLHPFYGVPIITGSKLKGIARDAGRLLCNEGTLCSEDFVSIFGDEGKPDAEIPAHAGRIDFLAGLPTSHECRLELDILTVHYPDYYSHGGADLDEQNPIPAPFPAVADGQEFAFYLVCRNRAFDDAAASKLLDGAETCLRRALLTLGVGGKTRAGYGRFRETQVAAVAEGNADDLFSTLVVQEEPVQAEVAAANPTAPSNELLQGFIAKWSGDQLRPDSIKKFAADIRSLPSGMRMQAFDACVPVSRRVLSDALWSAFRSRHHGIELLAELKTT